MKGMTSGRIGKCDPGTDPGRLGKRRPRGRCFPTGTLFLLGFLVLGGYRGSPVPGSWAQAPASPAPPTPVSRVHPLKPLRDACMRESNPVQRQLCWRQLVRELVRFNRERARQRNRTGDYSVDLERRRLLNALYQLEREIRRTWQDLVRLYRNRVATPAATERAATARHRERLRLRHQRLLRAYATLYNRYRARYPEPPAATASVPRTTPRVQSQQDHEPVLRTSEPAPRSTTRDPRPDQPEK